jgi:hypothetical protein
MECIEILTQLSVISNCALLFFTSKYFHLLFVSAKSDNENDLTNASIIANNPTLGNVHSITQGWTQTDFLKALVYVEHVCILFQIFLKQSISDITPKIITGERNRATMLATHLQKAGEGIKPETQTLTILEEEEGAIENEWDTGNSVVLVP